MDRVVKLGGVAPPLSGPVEDVAQGRLPLEFPAEYFSLTSDTVGRIREVLLRTLSEYYLPAHISIIREMRGVRFTLLTSDLRQPEVRRRLDSAGVEDSSRVRVFDNDSLSLLDFTNLPVWVRNSVVALSSRTGPVLLPVGARYDGAVRKLMERDRRFVRLDESDMQSVPPFSWGEVIRSADKTFVNSISLGTHPLRQELADFFGEGVVFVGDNIASSEHARALTALGDLDLWFAAGPPVFESGRLVDRKVFVGDPRMAVEAIRGMDGREFRSFQDDVLDIYLENRPRHTIEQLRQTHLEIESIQEENASIASALDEISRGMRKKGFSVTRALYLSLIYGAVMLPYPNCLQENFERDGKRTSNLWMPEFFGRIGGESSKIDAAAAKAFEAEGYQVHGVKNLGNFLQARHGGSLRCFTIPVNRGPYVEEAG